MLRNKCAWALAAMLGFGTVASAAAVGGGGTLILSPFDTDYNKVLDAGVTATFGEASTGTTGNWQIVGVIDGAMDHTHNDSGGNWTWLQDDSQTTGLVPAYAQWNRSTSFPAGTLIYDMVKFSYSLGTENYSVKVANGNPGQTSAAWAGAAGGTQSLSGDDGATKSPVNVTTLPSVLTINTLRAEFAQTFVRAGANSHAFIDEITVLPDRYTPIAITGQTSSGQGFPDSYSDDGNAITQWFHQTGGDEFLEINFGSAQEVNALVVYTYRGFPSDFTITDDTNTVLATVTGVGGGSSIGEVVPIKFNTPSLTQSLRLTFTTNQVDGVGGIAELVPLHLEPAPEPTALALLLPAGAVLLGAAQVPAVRER